MEPVHTCGWISQQLKATSGAPELVNFLQREFSTLYLGVGIYFLLFFPLSGKISRTLSLSHKHTLTRTTSRLETHTLFCFLPNEAKMSPELLRSSKFYEIFNLPFLDFHKNLTLLSCTLSRGGGKRLAPGCFDQQPYTGTHTHARDGTTSGQREVCEFPERRRFRSSRSAATRNFLFLSEDFPDRSGPCATTTTTSFFSSFTGKFRISIDSTTASRNKKKNRSFPAK